MLPLAELLGHLEILECALKEDSSHRFIPTRILHVPLSWNDIAARTASEKYMRMVRPNAPWCPDNIEFIRRINGLDSAQDVYDVLFNAEYLVMGLGDVYLGAPVSIPKDPRHRLVTTKYNPARTWTAENSVGIGGAYMGIYGMEGPGGYQLVGRTVQTWNTYRRSAAFTQPWLYRNFDVIRYFPVSHEELMQIRREMLRGTYALKIESSSFDLDEYLAFLREQDEGIRAFKARQQTAFEVERQHWVDNGLLNYQTPENAGADAQGTNEIPAGCEAINSPVAGMLWKFLVKEGQTVAANETLAVIECMKTEIDLLAPSAGVVVGCFAGEGVTIRQGQELLAFRPAQ